MGNDKGRNSGINYDYECIKSFMGTDNFHDISNEFGLDPQVLVKCFNAFASYIEIPKKEWDKYHAPYKDIVTHVPASTEVCNVDPILPEPYVEKIPFPSKVREHSIMANVVSKSAKKIVGSDELIYIEPVVAIVKDLVTKNIEDEHIVFCEDATNIVSHPKKVRKASVHVLSIKIGDHYYYGLCDIGASSSAIPYELYREIMHEIGPCEIEDIDVVIHLANREQVCPIGIVRYVEVLCGKIKYPADFLVLNSAASKTCPIIFGRPFLNTCGAIIDFKKEKVLTKFDGDSYEFNFSKFSKAPCENSLPNKDFRMERLASTDPVYDLGPLFGDCKYAHSDDKVVASDSYIVKFIQTATESYYERGKHGFMHPNNVKFPRFMLKSLTLHLF